MQMQAKLSKKEVLRGNAVQVSLEQDCKEARMQQVQGTSSLALKRSRVPSSMSQMTSCWTTSMRKGRASSLAGMASLHQIHFPRKAKSTCNNILHSL